MRRKSWFVIGVPCAAVVAGGLFFALPLVPVPPDNFADLTVKNDTPTAVVLRQCTHDGPGNCRAADSGQSLAPGATLRITVPTGIDQPYLVMTPDRSVTCLRLLAPNDSPITVGVSERSGCGSLGVPSNVGAASK